jgi:hypothetical protein
MVSISSYGQDENTMKNFDSTFVHTVFFWLNNPESDTDRKQFETSLRKFLDTSLYTKTNFIGLPPVSTREVVDGSFTYSLVVTFDSAESQKLYQEEKAHLLFIEESSKLWNKVIVYDSMGVTP